MSTKELNIKKYGCFYASDFHLEMILLPYIKNRLEKSNFLIFTEDNLLSSIKILLDRTNLNENVKNEVLNIKYWNGDKDYSLLNINFERCEIIVNGNEKFINEINNKIKRINCNSINIINCYDINKYKGNLQEIACQYDGILNTKQL